MAIQSKPYFWLTCDADECDSDPSDLFGGEFTAVSEKRTLYDYAGMGEWLVTYAEGSPERHFCPEHAGWYCRSCGAALSEAEQDAGEYECFSCVPELVTRGKKQ